jgi:regulatory protein
MGDADSSALPVAPPPRRGRSLRGRALAYLARREHSRSELSRKLAPHAESADQLAALLDELAAERLLSEERFAEGLSRSRGERYGSARVRQELRAHSLDPDLIDRCTAALAATELARARAVWQRRFGAPAADPAERARQMRFLAQRGFSNDAIRRVVGGRGDD